MELLTLVAIVVVLGLLLVWTFVDVLFFVRGIGNFLWGYFAFEYSDFRGTFVTRGICTTNDLDFMMHMNNARYLREMDFNRLWYFGSTGLFKETKKLNGTVVQSACTIRYRKPITFMQMFKIECKPLYWDDRSMYLEQRVITIHDGFIRAIAISKQTVIGVTTHEIMKATTGCELRSPIPPPELVRWIECNELSSNKLRKEAPNFVKEESTHPYSGADRIIGAGNPMACACMTESAAYGCNGKAGKIN